MVNRGLPHARGRLRVVIDRTQAPLEMRSWMVRAQAHPRELYGAVGRAPNVESLPIA
jgi:hypothetical protein